MSSITALNPAQIKEVFYLDAEANIRWARHSGSHGRFRKGTLVKGSTSSRGYNYLAFSIDGVKYSSKKTWIIWVLAYNYWPKHNLDHIDGDPTNDSLENLRDVTQSQNIRNNPRERSQQIIGVHYNHRYKKPYGVQFSINNKTKYFGRYYTVEEAECKAQEIRERLL